jgi:hypothetical protein
MSEALVDRVRATAAEAVVETAWAQWGRLGFMAGGAKSGAGEALIDPEALLVLTLDAVRWEPRLDQALSWWAVRGASLLSLPRVDYVLRKVPAGLDGEGVRFAARVWGAGGASASWKRRAKEAGEAPAPPPERLKGAPRPNVLVPPAVVLRVRAFAGVGAKADVLAYLAARGPEPSSVALITKALGYAGASIRQAAADLEAAGLAVSRPRRTGAPGREPARYVFCPGVLDLGDVPPWRFWPQIAAFLLGAARWGEDLHRPTPYLLSSRARDLHALLSAFWIEHPLPARYPVPDPARYPGEAYLDPFAESVAAVAAWLRDGLPTS